MRQTSATDKRSPRLRLLVPILLLALAVPATLVVFFGIRSVVFALDGEPYRMTLTPASGRCLVQFSQPDRSLVTPVFVTDLPIEAPRVVELRSDDLGVHGCVVEFYDSAPLPGRFRLRIGNTLYDVMEARIEVDGNPLLWAKANGPKTGTPEL